MQKLKKVFCLKAVPCLPDSFQKPYSCRILYNFYLTILCDRVTKGEFIKLINSREREIEDNKVTLLISKSIASYRRQ